MVHASTQALSAEKQRIPLSFRSIVLSLFLAALFGCCIPIVDFKMSNTFLGAMHMPAGAIAVLLELLLVINPLLRLLSGKLAFTRGETLTVYIPAFFPPSCRGAAPRISSCPVSCRRFTTRRARTNGSIFCCPI